MVDSPEEQEVYSRTVEELDFSKVVDSLSPTQLQHLFGTLGILQRDISKAEARPNTNDVNLKAKAVLLFWKQKNGKDATWKALLGALESLEYTHSKQILEEFLKQKCSGMSAASHHKPPAAWKYAQEIGREGDGEGEFRGAENVAVFDNGVMAAVDINLNKCQVYFFNKDCTYKSTLQSNSSNYTDKLLFPCDVAITSKQNLVVVDQSKYAKLFDVNGLYIKSINTLTPEEDPNTEVCTMAVAVTCNDDIVIGDIHRRLLTVHSEADGWIPRQIRLDLTPAFLSTNRQGHILVTCSRKEEGKPNVVKVVDMSGQEVYCIDTFMVDGKVGSPQGLVCDERGYVYIAVMEFGESGGKVFINTGHIHQYDSQGMFLKCIIKDIYFPSGLAVSKTGLDLYIANTKSVLKYSTT